MRNLVPLIVALMIGPPAAVYSYQEWVKAHPRIAPVDRATAEQQVRDDPSICHLDPFPSDRSRAMARAQCDANVARTMQVAAPAGASDLDLIDMYVATRWALAERYANGEITASEAAERLAAKNVELSNIDAERNSVAANAYANQVRARGALIQSLPQPAPLAPSPSTVTCDTFGTMTRCNSF